MQPHAMPGVRGGPPAEARTPKEIKWDETFRDVVDTFGRDDFYRLRRAFETFDSSAPEQLPSSKEPENVKDIPPVVVTSGPVSESYDGLLRTKLNGFTPFAHLKIAQSGRAGDQIAIEQFISQTVDYYRRLGYAVFAMALTPDGSSDVNKSKQAMLFYCGERPPDPFRIRLMD